MYTTKMHKKIESEVNTAVYTLRDNDLFLDISPKEYVLKIKDIPLDDKPREKLIQQGPEILSIQELLALILNI